MTCVCFPKNGKEFSFLLSLDNNNSFIITSHTISIWLTVTLAVFRYIAVCHHATAYYRHFSKNEKRILYDMKKKKNHSFLDARRTFETHFCMYQTAIPMVFLRRFDVAYLVVIVETIASNREAESDCLSSCHGEENLYPAACPPIGRLHRTVCRDRLRSHVRHVRTSPTDNRRRRRTSRRRQQRARFRFRLRTGNPAEPVHGGGGVGDRRSATTQRTNRGHSRLLVQRKSLRRTDFSVCQLLGLRRGKTFFPP